MHGRFPTDKELVAQLVAPRHFVLFTPDRECVRTFHANSRVYISPYRVMKKVGSFLVMPFRGSCFPRFFAATVSCHSVLVIL